MEPGDVVPATITEITQYGFYLTANEHTILVLIPEITWSGVHDTHDFGMVGESVQVMILHYVEQHQHYMGSIKQLYPEQNPWRFIQLYQIGQIFDGTVTMNTEYGSFIAFDTGVEGLLHIDHGGGSLAPGSSIKVKITEIFYEPQRVEFERVDVSGAYLSKSN